MRKYINLLAAIVVAITAVSCSRPHYNVADLIPAGADNIAVINFAEIASEAGVEIARDGTLVFPDDFLETLSPQTLSEIEAANNALRQSGIAIGSMGVYKPNDEEAPVYVFNLTNYKQFIKYILDNKGYHKTLGQLGIKTYMNNDRPERLLATRGDAVLVIDITGYEDEGSDNAWHYFIRADEKRLSGQYADSPLIKGNPAEIDKLQDGFRTILSETKPTPQDILVFVQDILSLI